MTWTNEGGGDHGGDDWYPANNEYINGLHYNIGTFCVDTNRAVYQSGMSDSASLAGGGTKLEIRAETVIIRGWLAAYGSGYHGGRYGHLNADGPGGAHGLAVTYSGAGGGYGYAGTPGYVSYPGLAGQPYGTFAGTDINFGSGGGGTGPASTEEATGRGGRGGGCIIIRATSVNVSSTGAIAADGEPGFAWVYGGVTSTNKGGAGSGGGVLIICSYINVDEGGIIRADGGAGVNYTYNGVTYEGGKGAMGRVKVFSYYPKTGTGSIIYTSGVAWTNESGGDHGGQDWVATAGMYANGLHYNIRNFIVPAGVTMLQYGAGDIESYMGELTTLEIRAQHIKIAGTLGAYGSGYWGGRVSHPNADGPGGGKGLESYSGGGGGYGGVGNPGHILYASSAGTTYDTPAGSPGIYHGSGGGATGDTDLESTCGIGGRGGGCIILRAETIEVTNTGSIKADGDTGSVYGSYRGGSGSGGGILITAKDISIVAPAGITANGGSGYAYSYGGSTYYGGAGGAGRIKLCTYNPRTGGGTLNTKNGEGTLQSGGISEQQLGNCTNSIAFGYIFNINNPLAVSVETISLYVRSVTLPGSYRIYIFDSIDRENIIGYGTIYINVVGEISINMYSQLDGVRGIPLAPGVNYYMEMTLISSTGDVQFSMCTGEEGASHHVRSVYYEVPMIDPYIKFTGFGHVTGAAIVNDARPTIEENLVSCMLVGGEVEIKADGTGAYYYRDPYTTRKMRADAYEFDNVSLDTVSPGSLTLDSDGYIIYKVPTYYPVIGTPQLTLDMDIYEGTPRIMVAMDPGNLQEPAAWYDIDDEVLTGENIYSLESSAHGVTFDGETIVWLKINADIVSSAALNDLILNIELDTSSAQLLELNKGVNTLMFEQSGGTYTDASLSLLFRERKLG